MTSAVVANAIENSLYDAVAQLVIRFSSFDVIFDSQVLVNLLFPQPVERCFHSLERCFHSLEKCFQGLEIFTLTTWSLTHDKG